MTTATWIWYPGDFEHWLHWHVSQRRAVRGMLYPTMWKLDTCYSSVAFRKILHLQQPETVNLSVEGRCNVLIDGQWVYNLEQFTVPAGQHTLMINVANAGGLPTIYIQGETLVTDTSWEVSRYSGGSNGDLGDPRRWVQAGAWNFDRSDTPPSGFRLATSEMQPVVQEQLEGTTLLLDFGRETFGYLHLHDVAGKGTITLYYGESREEALSEESDEEQLILHVDETRPIYELPSKAFRYVRIVPDENVSIGSISALYEYLPLAYRGAFRSSNERLNTIWDVSLYTFQLGTREFFLDGIKRDRWVWSGDAVQSALMNYYSCFDEAVTQRTFIALRGKDPVENHINLILDYTFYWFIGLYEYYLYTGDRAFIQQNYASMVSLMEFCLGRRNQEGFVEGQPGDWVFVDWAPIDNRGEVSTEQFLFARSLEAMAFFASLLGNDEQAAYYSTLAGDVKEKALHVFWDAGQQCFVHSRVDGQLSSHVTKYPNIFALLFDYLDSTRISLIAQHVLLNDAVQKITTPYMRFYELAALCEIEQHPFVLQEMLDYWGGMLDAGATTFWETFDPNEQGSEHYAMYGTPFGKSLCHSWGASPLYLLGKYFLGVRPLTPGYEQYRIDPHLGGLEWMEGRVPLPGGQVEIFMDATTIKVRASKGMGYLRIRSATPPVVAGCTVQMLEEQRYEVILDQPDREYVIEYTQANE